MFFLRIGTIFCVREAVCISDGSRILPCHLCLQNDLKPSFRFLIFPTFNLLAYFLEPVGAMVTRPVQGPWACLACAIPPRAPTMGSVFQLQPRIYSPDKKHDILSNMMCIMQKLRNGSDAAAGAKKPPRIEGGIV